MTNENRKEVVRKESVRLPEGSSLNMWQSFSSENQRASKTIHNGEDTNLANMFLPV